MGSDMVVDGILKGSGTYPKRGVGDQSLDFP